MNPALILALLAGGRALSSTATAFTKPQRLLNYIPGVKDLWREDRAMPLDWTARAKGEPDDNPEYIVKIRPDGTGETNRGRLLLPEDVKHFKDLERGPDRWQLYLAAVERRDRRYQNREPSVSSLTEIADQPGDPGQPLDKEQQWALMRFAQASKAGLVGGIPMTEGRDMAAEWRSTSEGLAERARKEDFSLTGKLGQKKEGNIDLTNRPKVKNKDGSISTVRTITIHTPVGFVLIPTVVGGRVVPEDMAITHYRKTGRHLGIFSSEVTADAYAQWLHEAEARKLNTGIGGAVEASRG